VKTPYKTVEAIAREFLLSRAARKAQLAADPTEEDYCGRIDVQERRWLIKDVTFPARSHTLVRVAYVSDYSELNAQGSAVAEYLYGTGRTWKGEIGAVRFVVEASSGTRIKGLKFAPDARAFSGEEQDGEAKCAERRLTERAAECVMTAGKPAEGETLRVRIEYDDRWAWWAPHPPAKDGIWKWKYTTTVVERADLETLSLFDLRQFRNTFFAWHGRIFKDPELQRSFEGSGTFYKPRPDYKEGDLNEIERRNVRTISEYEAEYQAELARRHPAAE
jgi:hypothetical protein